MQSINRRLKRTFGSKREEATGRWKKICIMKCFIIYILHQILLAVIISWRTSWVKTVACMGIIRTAYEILVRKHEGKRLLGRIMHRRENTGVGFIGVN
jgi:hypothetical protein